MRIVGGAWRGLHLAPVGAGDPEGHLRPTSDRVREAVFNLLINGRVAVAGDPVEGAVVLDLFAGTGALGLEALSRGAARAVFVDTGRAALDLLRRNVALARAGDRATVIARDVRRLGANAGQPASLVFLDPPYGMGLGEAALTAARTGGWIAPCALVVWEEAAPPPVPAGFAPLDQRRYGKTIVTLLRAV